MDPNCPGCVGRGTGTRCRVCQRPIPVGRRRAPGSLSELRIDCALCHAVVPHVHAS